MNPIREADKATEAERESLGILNHSNSSILHLTRSQSCSDPHVSIPLGDEKIRTEIVGKRFLTLSPILTLLFRFPLSLYLCVRYSFTPRQRTSWRIKVNYLLFYSPTEQQAAS
jgi:hypothetical protein